MRKWIKDIDFSCFERVLQLGLILVTFGDVVFDDELFFSICSGDLLIVELAKKLQLKSEHVVSHPVREDNKDSHVCWFCRYHICDGNSGSDLHKSISS